MLVGRKGLVDAAKLNSLTYESPSEGIGRPMKVCKEEIIGLLAALDLFQRTDHAAQSKAWRGMAERIRDALQGIPGTRVTVEHDDPRLAAPLTVVYLEPSWKGPSYVDLLQALQRGEPSIELGYGELRDALWITPVCLQPGQEDVVARRLREVLTVR
jgi:L-seryl-tRNA(Ser) seleniumtransferase